MTFVAKEGGKNQPVLYKAEIFMPSDSAVIQSPSCAHCNASIIRLIPSALRSTDRQTELQLNIRVHFICEEIFPLEVAEQYP